MLGLLACASTLSGASLILLRSSHGHFFDDRVCELSVPTPSLNLLSCLGNDLAELFHSALPCASYLSRCSPEDVALSKTVPRDHSNLRKTVCHISLPHIPITLSALVGGIPS